MYNSNSAFKGEKNKRSNAPIFLYTIEKYDGSNDLNLAEYDADVTYNGVVYSKFPIAHEEIGENTAGEVNTVKVTLSNVSRLIQSYLELYSFQGLKVTIKIVWANQLADASAHIDFIYYIDSYTADENNAEFMLTTKYDLLDVEIPNGRYNRNYCRWKFKGTECAYAGAETSCTKTKADCRDNKDNLVRFGGFPSIPSKRMVV